MITRQEGFQRLAREYVRLQDSAIRHRVGYIQGFEWAIETALGRQEEGLDVSWVRLAYNRVVRDMDWRDDALTGGLFWRETAVTLLLFEWGVYGPGEWKPVRLAEIPNQLANGRLCDVLLVGGEGWRLWPSGWELWHP
jgi:hypothetical protein